MSSGRERLDCMLDGVGVEKVTLKSSGRASACGTCSFKDWEPGDVKYVIEHWEDDTTDGYGREHLCPSCAVARGLSFEMYFHQNKNAPAPTPNFKANLKKRSLEFEEIETPAEKRAKPENMRTSIVYCKAVAWDLHQAKITKCMLSPHPECSFFVAWNGVLVLVYEGFPPSLVKAKMTVESSVSGVEPEQAGSKWPRSTLGTVKDDAGEQTLEELQLLKNLCMKYSTKLQCANIQIPIHSLSTMVHDNHSRGGLEQQPHYHARMDVPLVEGDDDGVIKPSIEEPESLEEKARVDRVVQEWSDLAAYLPKVNCLEDSPDSGASCVAFLNSVPGSPLLEHIADFQEEVDEKFPGRYTWLESNALHCALRSLNLKE